MPFIAFELDALRNVHHAARAAQLEPALVSHGLLQMWEWCWREKQDSVNATHLRGFFGGVAPSDALTAFGFLEETDVGKFRVRGTERYLRLGRARSKGGHAAKGNLKRGPSRGTSPAAAGSQPGNSPGCAPALTASSEQRAANSGEEAYAPAVAAPAKAPKKPKAGGDPRWKPLQTALVGYWLDERGTPYLWGGAKDSEGLKRLLGLASDAEILDRWAVGIAAKGWLEVATVAQLAHKWNDLAKLVTPRVPKGPPCATCGAPSDATVQGKSYCYSGGCVGRAMDAVR